MVRQTRDGTITARIVEVEAYGGSDDPASHAYKGITERNRAMFGKPGFAYVYFIYGNHFCLNVKAETEGVPGAVLIRAVEIIEGTDLAHKLRKASDFELSNGPGKLTKALDITRSQNGIDLTKLEELYICEPPEHESFEVVTTRRVGIRTGSEKPWRFYIKNNKHVSRL